MISLDGKKEKPEFGSLPYQLALNPCEVDIHLISPYLLFLKLRLRHYQWVFGALGLDEIFISVKQPTANLPH